MAEDDGSPRKPGPLEPFWPVVTSPAFARLAKDPAFVKAVFAWARHERAAQAARNYILDWCVREEDAAGSDAES